MEALVMVMHSYGMAAGLTGKGQLTGFPTRDAEDQFEWRMISLS
jgi:hypothetical protein